MDKVKAQLGVVWQHSFWVMCVGILIVCLVSWYISTRSIDQERQKQLADIKQYFEKLNSIRQTNTLHPNSSTEQGMDKLLQDLGQEVLISWQKQYDRQASVLVWPKSFAEDQVFSAQVEKMRPIEIVPPPPTPFAQDLKNSDRELYRNYIDVELPVLAETIGTEWRAVKAAVSSTSDGADSSGALGSSMMPGGFGASGGYNSGGNNPGNYGAAGGYDATGQNQIEDKSIVRWAASSQQEILNTHFGFISQATAPATVEVLYAQEDLWVLQNIMDIIKAANGEARANHEAAIKEIDFIRIGRSARGLAGTITSSAMSAAGGYSMGSDMPSGSAAMSMPGASTASTASADTASPSGATSSADIYGGGSAVSSDPAVFRYVDEKYQPLDPTRLRAAVNSTSKEDALLAVAKRMPVRLRFKVDQRKMNKVLAECGNARLPLEVRQVRINRPAAAAGGDSYGGGYGSGYGGGADSTMSGGGYDSSYGGGADASSSSSYGSSMSPGYGSGGGFGSAGGYGSAGGFGSAGMSSGFGGLPGAGGPAAARRVGGTDSTAAVDFNQIEVELYGIVYIYNPVNHKLLGLESTTESVAAPATPPAATTPASSPTPPPAASASTPPAAMVVPVSTN